MAVLVRLYHVPAVGDRHAFHRHAVAVRHIAGIPVVFNREINARRNARGKHENTYRKYDNCHDFLLFSGTALRLQRLCRAIGLRFHNISRNF